MEALIGAINFLKSVGATACLADGFIIFQLRSFHPCKGALFRRKLITHASLHVKTAAYLRMDSIPTQCKQTLTIYQDI